MVQALANLNLERLNSRTLEPLNPLNQRSLAIHDGPRLDVQVEVPGHVIRARGMPRGEGDDAAGAID